MFTRRTIMSSFCSFRAGPVTGGYKTYILAQKKAGHLRWQKYAPYLLTNERKIIAHKSNTPSLREVRKGLCLNSIRIRLGDRNLDIIHIS